MFSRNRWRIILLIGFLLFLYFFVNSSLYVKTFSKPLGQSGGDGYYKLLLPPKIIFYGESRGFEGGELGPAILPVDGADIRSFRSLGKLFGKDKDHVYFVWRYFQNPPQVVPNAEPESFVVVDPYYGHDNRSIYYGDTPLIGSNPYELKFLDSEPIFKYYRGNPRFVYSNGRVYYGTTELSEAVRNTSFVVSESVRPNVSCEQPTELRGGSFYRCAYPSVRQQNSTVQIDAKSFEILQHVQNFDESYARDKNFVYYIDRDTCGTDERGLLCCGCKTLQNIYVVEGADPETFVPVEGYGIDKDKHYGEPGNSGYKDGCVLPVSSVMVDGEARNLLVQHRSLPQPNVGAGGLCVYFTGSESPR